MEEHGPLAVIKPGLILGPLMGEDFGSSVGLIWKLMNGKFTKLPRYGCSIVDVRDVALTHVQAMIKSAAARQRILVGGRVFSMKDLSLALAQAFQPTHHDCPRQNFQIGSSVFSRLSTLMRERSRMS